MSDISEAVSEAIERANESEDRLNGTIALLVAIAATFMALMGVKAGNLGQAMAEAQSKTVNAWSYFQAKSTKQNLAEATLDQLRVQRAVAGATAGVAPATLATFDRKISDYEAKVQRYEREKNEIKTSAEGYQAEYERLNFHDDQFDLSDAALSVSIALFGVTALTKKRWLLFVAIAFMLLGGFFGLAGFFRWHVHPDALTSIFS